MWGVKGNVYPVCFAQARAMWPGAAARGGNGGAGGGGLGVVAFVRWPTGETGLGNNIGTCADGAIGVCRGGID